MIFTNNKIPFKMGPGSKTYKVMQINAADKMPWYFTFKHNEINKYELFIYTDMFVPIIGTFRLNKKAWAHDNRPE